jgi:hypothetical protein
VWGFLAGYAPAIAGSLVGHAPASTGHYLTAAEMVGNVRVLFRDIIPWMFGAGASPLLAGWVALVYLCGLGTLLFEIYAPYQKWKAGRGMELHPFLSLLVMNVLVGFFCLRLDNQGAARYLLPIYICIPYGIGLLMTRIGPRSKAPAALALGLFLFANWTADRRALWSAPRPAPYAPLTKYLVGRHYKGGYADYWLAYAITALSQEKMVLAPTGDNDRYKPYLDYVRTLKEPVLVGAIPRPLHSVVTVKGVSYRVIGREKNSGVTILRLEKAP